MTLRFWLLMFAASLFLYSVFVLVSASVNLWLHRKKHVGLAQDRAPDYPATVLGPAGVKPEVEQGRAVHPTPFHFNHGYTSDARERARLDLVTRLNGRG